ncbi:class I SAM-dependent DNA methyltransferase [Yoonia litorea]|uniref:Methyltransferase domain-containing protein n=1 Tax=Yoonia litorea TaxID=1123755 RepID=A0A1I6MUS7_9RHOB|nr:methyltransferase domain-containing protein [Yoonia litorea]SFS19482.1 Methyltransferase domain-containing protein [Yoonia litorea]
MAKLPDVDSAYALTSPDEIKDLYRQWSHSYDVGFGESQGYQLPREVAAAFVGAGGEGPVLDVGAGTGLVGEVLRVMNTEPIDGIDLSQEMLDMAAMKGIYRHLVVCDVTEPLDLRDAPYNGVVSAGTFTLGHVGPSAIHNLIDVAATGAVFVLSVNQAHYATGGFEAVFEDLGAQISALQFRDVRIYDDRADEVHRNDIARLVIFTKS